MRRDALRASIRRPAWTGPIVILLAMAMHAIGELSAIYIFSQAGICFGAYWAGSRSWRIFIVEDGISSDLVFAFRNSDARLHRFPNLASNFSSFHRNSGLISSGCSKFRSICDGNIIDLGYYKLQVVEACSGLRYIYPLLSLSFLAAYLFKAPLWQRALVFLSSIPLTIVMNSIRIGLVGVTVNYWGTQAADDVLHLFEGWIIFVACAGLLALEIYCLARMSGKSFFDVFHLPKGAPRITAKA